MAQVAQATLCLLNAERAGHSLAPLTEQDELTTASRDFSQLMVDEHFFAHVSPNGATLTDRLEVSGYLAVPGGWTVGENIAWGESYLASPDRIVQAWMDSPPHRENILSSEFEEIGLGIVAGVPFSSNAGATYTTDFGRRTPSADPGAEEDVEAGGSESKPATSTAQPPRRAQALQRSQPPHAQERRAAQDPRAQARERHEGPSRALDAGHQGRRRALDPPLVALDGRRAGEYPPLDGCTCAVPSVRGVTIALDLALHSA